MISRPTWTRNQEPTLTQTVPTVRNLCGPIKRVLVTTILVLLWRVMRTILQLQVIPTLTRHPLIQKGII